MLVLSRAVGESIIMDIGGLEVEILYGGLNDYGEARLLFTAPRAVKIFRKEVIKRDENGIIRRG